MNVFDLQAKISLDSSGFERNLKAAGGHMESFGQTVGSIVGGIGSALATAFAVDKVADFVTSAVGEFAKFEQLVGGVETLFGGSADQLRDYADKAYQSAGMSANDYMENATSFAAILIQSLEGDTDAAVEYANRAMLSMSDNANKMGTDMASIVGTYQSLSRGNYAMLDNLNTMGALVE